MMDNIREKLVELLKDTENIVRAWCGSYEDAADELIANGVTVQEWIPVTERLPSDEKDVLAYYGFGGLERRFIGTLSYFCFDPNPHWQHEFAGVVVTHWMPLPTPPKGE